jgi:subtilisin family serine protease
VADFGGNGGLGYIAAETTGRYLVLLDEDAGEAGMAALSEAAGVELVTASDVAARTSDEGAPEAVEGSIFFEQLGVAVVSAPPDQFVQEAMAIEGTNGIVAIEPERVVHAIESYAPPATGADSLPLRTQTPVAAPAPASRSSEYLQGYRDAVLHLTAPIATDAAAVADVIAAAVDESQATWGLQAVRALYSCRSGRGVRVAVLDTGLDLRHPDFAGRAITTMSFIPNQSVQDLHSHGTHCIGTAMGLKCVATGPRYGVAYEAEIYAGKVLSNAGSGTDGQILAGINWAVANGCAVISMSLGSAAAPGQRHSAVFEAVAKRASQAGTLIIAAAGNDSQRPNPPRPVGHPANCPSIMAVAALDSNLDIARFSNRGINPNGGQVDVAGPGVDVYSTVPMPARYGRKSGTSMATPHAAGVAALIAEANPGVRGAALGALLTARARRLTNLPSADVGAGLVQAP